MYKLYFKAERGWMEAAKVIASALECNERTVYRLIEGWERASQLPSIVLDAMAEQRIDPAAAKNAEMLGELLQMPMPATREKVDLAVAASQRDHILRKKQKARKAARKRTQLSVDDFVASIVKQFEDRYWSITPQEREVEVNYILELVAKTLRKGFRELRQYCQPNLAPKPTMKEAA